MSPAEIVVSVLFIAMNPVLWYSVGVRAERGKREKEQEAHEERQYQRSRRSGTVVLNTIKIRR